MSTFTGQYYQAIKADGRLLTMIERVYNACVDGLPSTLSQISAVTGSPEASVSAALRSLRKPKYGSHTVETTYVSDGLHQYRLIPNETGEVAEVKPTIKQANDMFAKAHTKYQKAYQEWLAAIKE